MAKKPVTILSFCAHNDDQVVGAGGALAKYAKEGKRIVSVIFSFGEQSHPHIRPEVAIRTRVRESQRAERILGGKDITYFNVKEGKFLEDFEDLEFRERVKFVITKYKPAKIFTHSSDDYHPDHRAVYKLITELTKEINYQGEIYSFDVWTLVNFRQRNLPKLVVDISDTFPKKISAFKAHKSQQLAILVLLWSVYLKAISNGLDNGCRFAEVFYRVR